MKKLLAALSLALLPLAASGQLVPLTDYYQYFGRGIALGTNAWTNAPGTLRRDPDGFRPQVSDGSLWLPVGDLSDAPSNTNVYGRRGGAWVPVPTNPASGSGSGFPLTNDVSAAGFDLTGGGTFQATNGSFRNLFGNGAHVTNLAGGTVAADLTLNQDLIVHGNFLVYGSSTSVVMTRVEHVTNVYVATNYIYETVYRTNVTYAHQITYVVTNTTLYATNYYTTIVNVGGSADYSLAASVLLPHLSDGAATNPVATGHWDYSAASLAMPQLLLSNGVATATGSWDFAGATVSGLPGADPDGFAAAGAAVVADGQATVWLASNAWWTLDLTGDVRLTNAAPWSIVTNGWDGLGLAAFGLRVATADQTNTFSWPSASKTNAPLPAPSSTNFYFVIWNGSAWESF